VNSVLLGAKYGDLATNEKGCESSKGCSVKKITKLPYFKEKKVTLPDIDHSLEHYAKI